MRRPLERITVLSLKLTNRQCMPEDGQRLRWESWATGHHGGKYSYANHGPYDSG